MRFYSAWNYLLAFVSVYESAIQISVALKRIKLSWNFPSLISKSATPVEYSCPPPLLKVADFFAGQNEKLANILMEVKMFFSFKYSLRKKSRQLTQICFLFVLRTIYCDLNEISQDNKQVVLKIHFPQNWCCRCISLDTL